MNINPFELLKNAKYIQEKMGNLQERLQDLVATGAAGAGMVEIDINGKMDVVAVRVTPEAAADIEMLQVLIMSAFSDGMTKIKEEISKEASAMTGGLDLQDLNIPGLPI